MEDVLSIPLNNLYAWQQVALMRLMLFVSGKIHTLMLDFSKTARGLVLAAADQTGKLDSLGAYQAQVGLAKAWGATFQQYQALLNDGIREGASLPFGVQAVYHEKLILPSLAPLPGNLAEAVTDGVFDLQLKRMIEAALRVSGPDGMQLSSRVWKFDRESREGINQALMLAVSEKKSAWQLAKDLEQFVGAGQDCPRWTYGRLNVTSSIEKSKGDLSGLIGGEDCAGQGVSYNALRLARTEIQRVHHEANDNRMAAMPWIEQERIVLSGSHPKADVCDEVVQGGENGDGIYPKGTIKLPLHPHCFCDKRAVQDLDKFGEQLKTWVQTGSGFPQMDQYAASLGNNFSTSLLDNPVAQAFGVWCFDQFEALAGRMNS